MAVGGAGVVGGSDVGATGNILLTTAAEDFLVGEGGTGLTAAPMIVGADVFRGAMGGGSGGKERLPPSSARSGMDGVLSPLDRGIGDFSLSLFFVGVGGLILGFMLILFGDTTMPPSAF